MFDKEKMVTFLTDWMKAWNAHDLEGVLSYMAEDVVFEHWNGRVVRGKRQLERAWRPWFAAHGNFQFEVKSVCIDEPQQALCFEWRLEWPSPEPAHLGKRELREGVDLVQLRDEMVVTKKSFVKTVVKIENRAILLKA